MSELDTIRDEVLAAAQSSGVSRTWQRDAMWLMLVHAVTAAVSLMVASWFLGQAPTWTAFSAPLLTSAIVLSTVSAVAVAPWTRPMRTFGIMAGVAAATSHVASYGPWWLGASLWAGVECAFAEVAVAALPALATILTLRCFAHRPERAAIGGVAAALSPLLVMDLTCPADGMAHAVGFHVLPALATAGGVALVRARIRSLSQVP